MQGNYIENYESETWREETKRWDTRDGGAWIKNNVTAIGMRAIMGKLKEDRDD